MVSFKHDSIHDIQLLRYNLHYHNQLENENFTIHIMLKQYLQNINLV